MDKLLEELILKYETRLQAGLIYQTEMKKGSISYRIQNRINVIWRIVLNDLIEISEKEKHDHKKR